MTHCSCGAMLYTLGELQEGQCEACQMLHWYCQSRLTVQRQHRLVRQARAEGRRSLRRKDVKRLVTGRKVS